MKLYKELKSSGIPVLSVNSNGQILLSEDATLEQKELSVKILEAHDPYDPIEERRKEYPSIEDSIDYIHSSLKYLQESGIDIGPGKDWVTLINSINIRFPVKR